MELEQGSSSSNTSIDSQIYWNNLLNQIDRQEITDCLLSPGGSVLPTPFTDGNNLESGSFNRMSFDNPESSGNAANLIHFEDVKRDNVLTSALVSTTSMLSRQHERRFGPDNMLSMNNVDIKIDNSQIPITQEYNASENSAYNTSTNGHSFNSLIVGNQISQSGIGSTSYRGTSAGNRYFTEDNNGRRRGPADWQRVSGKRKIFEGASGQSSTRGSMKNLLKGESSQQVVSVGESSNIESNISNSSSKADAGGIIRSPGASIGTTTLGCHSTVSSAENTCRNVRRRINPCNDHDMLLHNLWHSGNSPAHPNIGSPSLPSSFVIPCAQLPEAEPMVPLPASQVQSTIPMLPQDPHSFVWTRTSGSQAVASSGFLTISGERYPSRRARRNISVPVTGTRHLAEDPVNWNLCPGNMNSLGSVPSSSNVISSSTPNPSLPPTCPHPQIPTIRYPIRLSDLAQQSIPSSGSDLEVQNNNVHLQDLSPSDAAQGVFSMLSRLRSHQRQLLRSNLFMERQNDIVGVPLPLRMAALREGRSQMISEIRSALDVIRRGDSLRFESMLSGGVDLHDRHRDMRLDVDNMSYEELLALGERIGNVSTGLDEETILKHLKQQKYTSSSVDSSQDVEPCCICQEEYVEEEDLGTLNCGHNFHSKCIKKWLSHKNSCPICKTTGLVV